MQNNGKDKHDGPNFESVKTYMESIYVFVLILSGTYLYTLRHISFWITPVLILSYGILFVASHLLRKALSEETRQKEDDPLPKVPRAFLAAYIWIGWLVYGALFEAIAVEREGVIFFYLQSFLVVFFVLLSYWRGKGLFYTNVIFFATLLLLLIPQREAIGTENTTFVLFCKVIFFFVIYTVGEFLEILRYHADLESFRSDHATKMGPIIVTETKIVQAGWILLIPKYFLFGVAVQLIVLYNMICEAYNAWRKRDDAALPGARTASSSPVVKKSSVRSERGDSLSELEEGRGVRFSSESESGQRSKRGRRNKTHARHKDEPRTDVDLSDAELAIAFRKTLKKNAKSR